MIIEDIIAYGLINSFQEYPGKNTSMRFIMKNKRIINLSIGRSNTKNWFENGFYIGTSHGDFYVVRDRTILDSIMSQSYNMYREEFGL